MNGGVDMCTAMLGCGKIVGRVIIPLVSSSLENHIQFKLPGGYPIDGFFGKVVGEVDDLCLRKWI
jgi:hypothetical protein